MNDKHIRIIAEELVIPEIRVKNTVKLLSEGGTVPFISRYRKEMTGSLDEVQIAAIKDRMTRLEEIDKRKSSILKSIEESGKLTAELRKKLEDSYVMSELEDLYLPYKPKRKTRASVAIENGLEPLAVIIFRQQDINIRIQAEAFITDKILSTDDAIQGALDIISEWINEDVKARETIRRLFANEAIIYSSVIKGKTEEGVKYRDYFDYHEPLKRCPSHRYLAIRRGETEGFLKVSIEPETEKAISNLEKVIITGRGESAEQVRLAIKDSYKRLLCPSIETEFKQLSKEKADEEAIRVFAENLRQLLLAPPLGQKKVLAIDPGFRTGCKLVCLDEQGNLLHNETIFPHSTVAEEKMAQKKISSLINSYKIDAIAIGNGTASRETEDFIRTIKYDRDIQVFIVSENGASVYSASAVAREEFPEYDVTVRGAISIGRRLMDPLAELVKIDPKSIGVGQYQHDVDQANLKNSLDQVVEFSVNKVGVNLNTASKHLLTYVSGLGSQLAQNILNFRKENGPFQSRMQLLKVPRMGVKAFEQSAGFLRIPDAKNPLDNSAVHPESYHIVEKMADDLHSQVETLLKEPEIRKKIDINKYVGEKIGLPTLKDIMDELSKPGRDPRSQIKIFEFSKDVRTIEDVKPGMELPGIVTNITKFGAFVDIGVKQDGLVHISQLTDHFVSDPNEIVKIHQHVKVKVIEIDISRKRIQLSMKDFPIS
jgi:uncharacterized protein